MKALSVKQPWAGLIATGVKTIETRTWKTNYRGPLLICASASPKSEFSGKAVCVVTLVDCREMTKSDEAAACCQIYPNAKAWVLRDVQLIEPFPVKGQLRIFEVNWLCLDCEYRTTVFGKDPLLNYLCVAPGDTDAPRDYPFVVACSRKKKTCIGLGEQ